jgi:hypothetical protein
MSGGLMGNSRLQKDGVSLLCHAACLVKGAVRSTGGQGKKKGRLFMFQAWQGAEIKHFGSHGEDYGRQGVVSCVLWRSVCGKGRGTSCELYLYQSLFDATNIPLCKHWCSTPGCKYTRRKKIRDFEQVRGEAGARYSKGGAGAPMADMNQSYAHAWS